MLATSGPTFVQSASINATEAVDGVNEYRSRSRLWQMGPSRNRSRVGTRCQPPSVEARRRYGAAEPRLTCKSKPQNVWLTDNDIICQYGIMAMTSMNISLPDELKQYVEAQTKAGYSTPSEYVRELIREDQKRRAQQRLEELLVEGLKSGDSVVADETFWAALKTEALEQMEARRKSRTKKR